jgi:mRNA-degrading endonuclease toxin of MazEF toxin-antitoxin module
VALPDDCPVQGVAFADQVKCLDWRARHARLAAVLPAVFVAQVLARTRALLE